MAAVFVNWVQHLIAVGLTFLCKGQRLWVLEKVEGQPMVAFSGTIVRVRYAEKSGGGHHMVFDGLGIQPNRDTSVLKLKVAPYSVSRDDIHFVESRNRWESKS